MCEGAANLTEPPEEFVRPLGILRSGGGDGGGSGGGGAGSGCSSEGGSSSTT